MQNFRKIEKYDVVSTTDLTEFKETMNAWIYEGWQPFGGLSVTANTSNEDASENYRFKYSQAVVLYEKERS